MSTPSCCLSLSFSLSASSLPSRAALSPSVRYLSLSRVRSPRHFLVNYRARGRQPRGEEEFPHTRASARARAFARAYAGPSSNPALRAGFSRVSSRGNSVGNVERESGIAVAPLFLPSRLLPFSSSTFVLVVVVVVVLRRERTSAAAQPRGYLLSATRRRAARPTSFFPIICSAARAFFSFTPFSYLFSALPLVATLPPLLPSASLSSPLCPPSPPSVVHPPRYLFFFLSLPLLLPPPPSLPPCLYLCLCPPVHIPLPLGASHESSIGPGGCTAHRPFNSATSTSSIHRASIYQWQVEDYCCDGSHPVQTFA